MSTRPLSDDEIKQRFKIAEMLMQLDEDCRKLKAEREYYLSTGEVPTASPVESGAASAGCVDGDSYKLYENARKQLAKLKGKITGAKKELETATGDDKIKLLADINVWETKQQQAAQTMEKYKPKKDVKGS